MIFFVYNLSFFLFLFIEPGPKAGILFIVYSCLQLLWLFVVKSSFLVTMNLCDTQDVTFNFTECFEHSEK